MTSSVSHLVFDLGGVIVKLRGTPIPLEWFPADNPPSDIWARWLTSESPRLFESGQIGQLEFSQRLVEDLSLSATPEEFLGYFSDLPESVYEGAKSLLAAARKHYTTACFSNSNELHWEGKLNDMGLNTCFDHYFASHLMGVVKPDIEGFHHVVDTLNVEPSRIAFFDDNQMNVDAAHSIGMRAERVAGVAQLKLALLSIDEAVFKT